jgi:hypothetical protein
MGLNQDTAATVAAAAAPILSVVALWLRLVFRLRAQQERRRYLQSAATLPAGTRLQESHDDGSVLTMTVGSAHRPEDQR